MNGFDESINNSEMCGSASAGSYYQIASKNAGKNFLCYLWAAKGFFVGESARDVNASEKIHDPVLSFLLR
jgi:hypothetical protein